MATQRLTFDADAFSLALRLHLQASNVTILAFECQYRFGTNTIRNLVREVNKPSLETVLNICYICHWDPFTFVKGLPRLPPLPTKK